MGESFIFNLLHCFDVSVTLEGQTALSQLFFMKRGEIKKSLESLNQGLLIAEINSDLTHFFFLF